MLVEIKVNVVLPTTWLVQMEQAWFDNVLLKNARVDKVLLKQAQANMVPLEQTQVDDVEEEKKVAVVASNVMGDMGA